MEYVRATLASMDHSRAKPVVIESASAHVPLPNVFDGRRYRLLARELLERKFAGPDQFVKAASCELHDLSLIHTESWVAALQRGLTRTQLAMAELPYDPSHLPLLMRIVGGTILTAESALHCGAAFHIGGGFHHAFADHGEGFCLVHDVAIAARKLQRERGLQRIMVMDVDAHQGNGTAAIFAGDSNVFTYSIHEEDNYPEIKPPSDVDVGLERGIGDRGYLRRLEETFVPALHAFAPNLIFYIAGSDPYAGDQLSGLGLTKHGLRQRDRLVFQAASALDVPCAVVMGGGYARDVLDTVLIYVQTWSELCDAYS